NFAAGPWSAMAAIATDMAGGEPGAVQLGVEVRGVPGPQVPPPLFFLRPPARPPTPPFEGKAQGPMREMVGQLRPGFTAKIRCPLPGRPTSLVIPEEAMRASERGFVVYRPKAMKNGKNEPEYVAEAVPVEPGQRTPGWVEIMKGLRPGDWI